MVLIIDNYDSFTYNLYQQIARLGYQIEVFKNDEVSAEKVGDLKPSHIIISPGPGRPAESGISREVIKRFYKSIPILGVCLGHQCIGEVFGVKTVSAKHILHGKAGPVRHNKTGLFSGLPTPLTAARYHSLAVNQLPEGFKLSAWADDGDIMAFQHQKHPLYGVQFHPESFLTRHGDMMMENFLHA